MTKTILKYGLISGSISSIWMLVMSMNENYNKIEAAEIIGYSLMLVAFALVYVGIKNYRDTIGEGVISFGKALMLGLLMSLVAATLYVVAWNFIYYLVVPDFMDKYAEMCMNKMKTNGANEVEMASKLKEMEMMKEWYKNPMMIILLTYAEILPIGILASLISASVLKRKEKK